MTLPRFRAPALLLAAVLAGLLWVATGAPPASAHSELVSSSPADGATGADQPTEVTLTFNENIADTGLQVVAMGPDGALALDTPTVAGPNVTAAWPADAPDGRYQVSYRVVSADGHPIDGTISFSYGDALGSAAPGTAPSDAAPAPADPATAASDDPMAISTAASAEDESSGFPLWIPAVVVVVGVAIGAAIARAMRSRAPQR